MPGPTLTAQEIAQLTKEKAKAESAAATFTAAVAGQQARAAELATADAAFKKFFDYYNADIIGKYDDEQRWINGRVLTSPILEADIVSCASLAGGRIQPALPATDVVRISQFDGTPFTTNADNELQRIANQAGHETTLQTGYGGTAPAATVLTNTAITPSSTTLQLEDLTTTFSIAPNSVFVVANGGDLAVVKILTFVMQVSPVPPPYIADCTIQLIVPPSGTIAIGQQLTVFSGFNNTERTNKVASNPQLQPLMNYLIAQLQSEINARITTLNNQLTAIAANQDPDGTAALATATTNVNASKTFLTNYLVTTIISNTGLTSLSTERGTRTTQANSRVTAINAAYTGQSKNYYNERYNAANNRANTSRGSLRLQKAAEQTASQSQSFAATLGAQASAIGSILP
jgi:hypothetical protein